MANVFAKVKVPVVGLTGAGTGITVGTLAAEYTSRVTGQVGWNACAVKAGVKGAIGLLGYALSQRLGVLGSFFAEMFAYGAWGSIFLDIASAAYPGGITGLAEDWASTTRVYAAGGKRVVRELGKIEGVAPSIGAPAGATAKASAVF